MNETETLAKHISCEFITCNLIQKWNNDKFQWKRKNITSKKDYSFNLSIYVCENRKHLKSNVVVSVITCNEIKSVTDSVLSNVTSI